VHEPPKLQVPTAVLNGPAAAIAGEAAGFQDHLLGFGIRSAIVSGYLAAQQLLGRDDYEAARHEN